LNRNQIPLSRKFCTIVCRKQCSLPGQLRESEYISVLSLTNALEAQLCSRRRHRQPLAARELPSIRHRPAWGSPGVSTSQACAGICAGQESCGHKAALACISGNLCKHLGTRSGPWPGFRAPARSLTANMEADSMPTATTTSITVGYCRVSTDGQSLISQQEQL
jgi:hypothetical protein